MYVHTMDRWDGMGGPQRPPAGRRGEERRGEERWLARVRRKRHADTYIVYIHMYIPKK
jgi:hypothetical protein